MEFLYLVKALYQRKWVILASVLIAIAVAYFFTRSQKPAYKSVAQIATGFTTKDDAALSNERYSGPQTDIRFNNVIENLTSPKV